MSNNTVQGDQICNMPAGNIDMTGIPPGILTSQNQPAVAIMGLGTGLSTDGTNLNCTITGNVQADWNGTGLAAIQNKPSLATVATSGSYADLSSKPTIPAAQVQSDWNSVTSPSSILNKPTIPTIATPVFAQGVFHSLVTTTASTGFQVSSTRNAIVHYTVTITVTASIAGGASGTIFLEIAATNSTTPSDWVEVSHALNSQTYSLAVALQGVQISGQVVSGLIPAGYYARLRQLTGTGTVTFAYNTGQEVLL